MRILLWRFTSPNGGTSLLGVTYNTLSTLGYWECSVGFSPPSSYGETLGHLDHCTLSDDICQHSSCNFRRGSRTESCTEVATLKYRNGTETTSTLYFQRGILPWFCQHWQNHLSNCWPSAGSAVYMEDSFPHRVCFLQMSGWNPCFRTCPTITDRRLDTGDSPSRPIIHIKTQVLSKGPKCLLSCTTPAFDCHLSNGMAEDRLLCEVRALRFYMERAMPWREHKRLLLVLF